MESLKVAPASGGDLAALETVTRRASRPSYRCMSTAADAPVQVDVSELAPGELKVVDWYGRPVWVMRRTKEQLAAVTKADDKVTDPRSLAPMQPEYARNEYRSIKPEVMVLVGICTHKGCTPQAKGAEAKGEMGADWNGGFLCPCHGSRFDLAGRIYKGGPAPVNLEVPPHRYVSDRTILIGVDEEESNPEVSHA